tara:strand:+ start:575 stop:934 length:360 start_codon:yes stop_codon:yes gene_type:complete
MYVTTPVMTATAIKNAISFGVRRGDSSDCFEAMFLDSWCYLLGAGALVARLGVGVFVVRLGVGAVRAGVFALVGAGALGGVRGAAAFFASAARVAFSTAVMIVCSNFFISDCLSCRPFK